MTLKIKMDQPPPIDSIEYSKFEENAFKRVIAYDKSLKIFSYQSPIRLRCISLITSTSFDIFIAVVISVNSIYLALLNPERELDNDFMQGFYIASVIFQVVYTLEMMIRVIARGFFYPKKDKIFSYFPAAYLRRGWSQMDFVIIITGWVDLGLFGLSDNLSLSVLRAIRLLRVFRLLRLVYAVHHMRVFSLAIFKSFKPLARILALFFLVFFFFSVISLHLFKNTLAYRCFDAKSKFTEVVDADKVCSKSIEFGYQCLETERCLFYGNPDFGITNYDTFYSALLLIFINLTLEGWSKNMYMLQDGSVSSLTTILFVVMIIIGAFFVVNLVVAVLCDTIEEMFTKEMERHKKLRSNLKKLQKKENTAKSTSRVLKWKNSLLNLLNLLQKNRSTTKVNGGFDANIRRKGDFVSPNVIQIELNDVKVVDEIQVGEEIIYTPPQLLTTPLFLRFFSRSHQEKIFRRLDRLYSSSFYHNFMIFVIVVNAAMIGSLYSEASDEHKLSVLIVNRILLSLFVVDLFLHYIHSKSFSVFFCV